MMTTIEKQFNPQAHAEKKPLPTKIKKHYN